VLNTIVAESLDYMASKLEADVKGGKSLNQAIQELLPPIVKESKRVLFNGNNYAEEWHNEAAKRGLPNNRTTVDALPALATKKARTIFSKFGVLSERELLRAMFDVGYFPPNTPPDERAAGHWIDEVRFGGGGAGTGYADGGAGGRYPGAHRCSASVVRYCWRA